MPLPCVCVCARACAYVYVSPRLLYSVTVGGTVETYEVFEKDSELKVYRGGFDILSTVVANQVHGLSMVDGVLVASNGAVGACVVLQYASVLAVAFQGALVNKLPYFPEYKSTFCAPEISPRAGGRLTNGTRLTYGNLARWL